MAKHDVFSWLKSRLKLSLLPKRNAETKGFTLLELLVTVAIAGGIVSGLMLIVVQLMGTDQREASRSETQREMQMAMDYISAELREAVYVYTGSNLQCAGGTSGGGCVPLTSYLPASLSNNSVPIIAFWKQQPFPETTAGVRGQCYGNNPPRGVSCLTGSSYALIVYSLSKAPSTIWSGSARITRYALTEFDSQGNLNKGYVNPGAFNNFATWPFGKDDRTGTGQIVDLRNVTVLSGRATGAPADIPPVALVDFVDGEPRPGGATACSGDGTSYSISPTDAMLNSTPGFNSTVRGFYACVSIRPQAAGNVQQEVDIGVNQDVLLYLRGNSDGRPGITGDGFLPALETRVLSRGVLTKRPSN
ncbi:MAG: prepilin-type N-terminal cleavage/methylation domain-containing protein [Oscillatoriophycideae cyanobacterium NC_groundwater_1537_Pr4_S-0.65um_50_18]|nr:prepilin-type N-terminal cleavage/methylation domain-containing protein [Oscillatoriophycideae cyanobacterium NC_groundwater_1537_Pr4_S-0.65um_50_18]